jgi:hypothetical protein
MNILFHGNTGVGGLPAGEALRVPIGRFLEHGLIGKGCEGGYQQSAARRLEDAGVTVVDGRIHQGFRPGPGGSAVGGAHQFDAPERADMRFAPTRTDEQQFSIGAAG